MILHGFAWRSLRIILTNWKTRFFLHKIWIVIEPNWKNHVVISLWEPPVRLLKLHESIWQNWHVLGLEMILWHELAAWFPYDSAWFCQRCRKQHKNIHTWFSHKLKVLILKNPRIIQTNSLLCIPLQDRPLRPMWKPMWRPICVSGLPVVSLVGGVWRIGSSTRLLPLWRSSPSIWSVPLTMIIFVRPGVDGTYRSTAGPRAP